LIVTSAPKSNSSRLVVAFCAAVLPDGLMSAVYTILRTRPSSSIQMSAGNVVPANWEMSWSNAGFCGPAAAAAFWRSMVAL
jgi:hypothetical protein